MRRTVRVIVGLLAIISTTILPSCAGEIPNDSVSNIGRIILKNQASPADSNSFAFEMSYGAQVAYPDGLSMRDGQQVDSGFTLPPGIYTINESVPAGWQLTIDIHDPSGVSSSSGSQATVSGPSGGSSTSGSQATIDLAAGETVIVTFINTKVS